VLKAFIAIPQIVTCRKLSSYPMINFLNFQEKKRKKNKHLKCQISSQNVQTLIRESSTVLKVIPRLTCQF